MKEVRIVTEAGIRLGRLVQEPKKPELGNLPICCGLSRVAQGIIVCAYIQGCFAHNPEVAKRYFGSSYCVPGDNGRNCYGQRD